MSANDAEFKIWVPGDPVTKGSVKTITDKKTGKGIVIPDNKRTKPWQRAVSDVAALHWGGAEFWTGPVALVLNFSLPFSRQANYEGQWHVEKFDIDKLARAILDALTKVVYKDDAQVAMLSTCKSYSRDSGVKIEAWQLEEVENYAKSKA